MAVAFNDPVPRGSFVGGDGRLTKEAMSFLYRLLQFQRTTDDLSALTADLAAANAQIAAQAATIAALNASVQAQESTIAGLQASLTTANTTNATQAAQIAALQADVAAIEIPESDGMPPADVGPLVARMRDLEGMGAYTWQ